MMNELIIDAPCKINLHLRVLGKRDDGFHDLESIFMALDFGDTLGFTVLDTDGDCEINMDGTVPREKNLVFKAVSLFREYTGFSESVSIDIQKNIPFGAGLGGGSSDAASTLKALNVLGNYKLKHEELHNLALTLGSDVPFFLNPGTAFVSGRGEKIESVHTPDGLYVVLVNQGFASSTAEAFRLLDERGDFDSATSKHQIIDALTADPSDWPYRNDFLPAFLSNPKGKEAEKKAYRDILQTLKDAGSSFSGLSGSGSTCFGVFKDQGTAEKAVKSFEFAGNFAKLTIPLARRGIPVLEY
ncbi:MAG: 4-(cytidine 5'-diphospho)-2-C-methyl-D-erythritol kinase [Treponema sp.]|nr:4-(cytidine 5'-diphospho)-2-C-methyl-D-erythritol kinase [Treponema sp.]